MAKRSIREQNQRIALSGLLVALMLGVVLALVNFLRIWFFTPYDKTVAFVVSMAMFFTIIIAKSIVDAPLSDDCFVDFGILSGKGRPIHFNITIR